MFTIYNKGSVQFRGTSDNLYSLNNKVEAISPTILNPDDELYNYIDNDKNKNQYSNEALNIYKRVARLDTTEEVYHVRDIMTRECITINVNLTVEDAYDTLKANKIGQIPVVNDSYQIDGLINKKMILNMLMNDLDNSRRILKQRLRDIDLKECITADPITDIRRVAKVILEYKLDAVPVVNNNDILVGIVSKTDIIKAVSYIPNLKLWA
ncbi:MAG: CBS domain-containing protein [Arcobacteraceae bacterium]|jgi:CBS domain-containing protein|nr:CBS domain-containing protein [Arcobacteraceae bacterium]